MLITFKTTFGEQATVRLLNHLADENRRILIARPDLPGVYQSGVYYRREERETWCDYITMLAQGHEDCDGLAAARTGELLARGWKALRKGDGGYALAARTKPRTIKAEVMLTTRNPVGVRGLYHCIVKYKVGGQWFRDDPSARLGM